MRLTITQSLSPRDGQTVTLLPRRYGVCPAGGSAALESSDGDGKFISEPQDAVVPPGGRIQLDCELIDSDVCAWRIDGTQLGVDHFYNVEPPPKVHALFPDHERVCSIVITDIDWRYDGYWTCWPLGQFSHYSSRAARVTVSGQTGGHRVAGGNTRVRSDRRP